MRLQQVESGRQADVVVGVHHVGIPLHVSS
jgi:hypothetical protein